MDKKSIYLSLILLLDPFHYLYLFIPIIWLLNMKINKEVLYLTIYSLLAYFFSYLLINTHRVFVEFFFDINQIINIKDAIPYVSYYFIIAGYLFSKLKISDKKWMLFNTVIPFISVTSLLFEKRYLKEKEYLKRSLYLILFINIPVILFCIFGGFEFELKALYFSLLLTYFYKLNMYKHYIRNEEYVPFLFGLIHLLMDRKRTSQPMTERVVKSFCTPFGLEKINIVKEYFINKELPVEKNVLLIYFLFNIFPIIATSILLFTLLFIKDNNDSFIWIIYNFFEHYMTFIPESISYINKYFMYIWREQYINIVYFYFFINLYSTILIYSLYVKQNKKLVKLSFKINKNNIVLFLFFIFIILTYCFYYHSSYRMTDDYASLFNLNYRGF